MKRELWSSQTGFILASAGAAIGLGQIWKFPYMAGQNGGGIFVLTYIICIFLLAIPTFMSEVLIGFLGKKNVIDSLKEVSCQRKPQPFWLFPGYLGLLTLFLVLCFYNVAASWSLGFLYQHFLGGGVQSHYFGDFLSDPLAMFSCYLVYTLVSFHIVARGVKKGIEKICNVMLPLLIALLIILVLWSASLPGFSKAMHFLFYPDVSQFTWVGFLEAVGHSLFSLATGAGCALAYGSYIPKNVNVGKATLAIALCNICVALLAGLAIFPIVFSFDLNPEAGAVLMYKVLPVGFNHISFGYYLLPVFFLMLFVAALTSSISLIEPLVGRFIEKYGLGRVKASLLLMILSIPPSCVCILSFNQLEHVKVFGFTFFELIADFLVSIFLSLGALGFVVFAVKNIRKEIIIEKIGLGEKVGNIIYSLMLTVVPLALVFVLFAPFL